MIYEFRTYTLKPRSLAEVEKRYGEAYEYRKKYSPLAAFWHTEVGPLNEIIHVWGYKDLAERARIRAEASKDANWPPKIREFVIDQDVEVLAVPVRPRHHAGHAGPDLRDPALQPHGGLAARRHEALGGSHRERIKLSPLVLAGGVEFGAANRFVHIWAYKSMDQRLAVREQARKAGIWPPPGAATSCSRSRARSSCRRRSRRCSRSGPMPPTKLAHLVFQTNRLPAMRDWYCTVLDGRVIYENAHLSFVTYDDEHHRVAFIDLGPLAHGTWRGATPVPGHRPARPPSRRVHLRLHGRAARQLRAARRAGRRPFRSISHGPTTSMYYVDPDGNRVELQIDNFATAEEGQAWMLSPAFHRNPIGVEFDPDDLARRFHAGVPVAELVIRD